MVIGGLSKSISIRSTCLKRSRPNITIFFTVVAVAISFAWLGVENASKWQAGVVLYILGRKWPDLSLHNKWNLISIQ